VFFLSVSLTNFAIFLGKIYSPFFHITKLKKEKKRKLWVLSLIDKKLFDKDLPLLLIVYFEKLKNKLER